MALGACMRRVASDTTIVRPDPPWFTPHADQPQARGADDTGSAAGASRYM
jgi:hypothetical protein